MADVKQNEQCPIHISADTKTYHGPYPSLWKYVWRPTAENVCEFSLLLRLDKTVKNMIAHAYLYRLMCEYYYYTASVPVLVRRWESIKVYKCVCVCVDLTTDKSNQSQGRFPGVYVFGALWATLKCIQNKKEWFSRMPPDVCMYFCVSSGYLSVCRYTILAQFVYIYIKMYTFLYSHVCLCVCIVSCVSSGCLYVLPSLRKWHIGWASRIYNS